MKINTSSVYENRKAYIARTMKKLLSSVLLLMAPTLIWSQRYLQPVFYTTISQSGVAYGQANAWDGTPTPLAMDVYTPQGDTQILRPVMLFLHGGSFVNGVRNDVVMTTLCDAFARRGYVTATASYRLGVNLANLPQLNLEFVRAAIRATHDAKAAVRFLRRSVAEQGNPYGIDTNRIYIGGYSAGSIAAIHVAYLTDTSSASVLLRNELRGLGGLEGNSGNAGYSAKVHGVFNMAGAILDTNLIASTAATAIHFHGTADNVVPYARGFVQANGFPVVEVDGSSLLHARLQNRGSYSELVTYTGVGHDLVSDTARWNHLVLNTARFFYNLQNNSVSVPETHLLSAQLFPNPACESMAIRSDEHGILRVSIFDTSGKRLISSENGTDERISVAELPAGLYIAHLQNGTQSRMQKIIVTKTCP